MDSLRKEMKKNEKLSNMPLIHLELYKNYLLNVLVFPKMLFLGFFYIF
jgi:hypothetical protein